MFVHVTYSSGSERLRRDRATRYGRLPGWAFTDRSHSAAKPAFDRPSVSACAGAEAHLSRAGARATGPQSRRRRRTDRRARGRVTRRYDLFRDLELAPEDVRLSEPLDHIYLCKRQKPNEDDEAAAHASLDTER